MGDTAQLPDRQLCQKGQGALDVAFYYMSNVLGRLLDTLFAGWVIRLYGQEACLWVSSRFVLSAALISVGLPRQ